MGRERKAWGAFLFRAVSPLLAGLALSSSGDSGLLTRSVSSNVPGGPVLRGERVSDSSHSSHHRSGFLAASGDRVGLRSLEGLSNPEILSRGPIEKPSSFP